MKSTKKSTGKATTRAAKSTLLSAKELATRLDISERLVYQLAEEDWIKRPDGQEGFAFEEGALGYIEYLRHRIKTESRGGEMARVARARAIKLEIENLRQMGELQPVSQVEETFDGLVNIIRTSIEGMPGRLASELASISDPPKVYQRLRDELRSITDRSADYLAKRAEALGAVPKPREEFATEDSRTTHEVGRGESDDAAGFAGAGAL